MSRRMTAFMIASIMGASFLLSACGVKGDLERPPPLWGEKSKQQEPDDQDDNGS